MDDINPPPGSVSNLNQKNAPLLSSPRDLTIASPNDISMTIIKNNAHIWFILLFGFFFKIYMNKKRLIKNAMIDEKNNNGISNHFTLSFYLILLEV